MYLLSFDQFNAFLLNKSIPFLTVTKLLKSSVISELALHETGRQQSNMGDMKVVMLRCHQSWSLHKDIGQLNVTTDQSESSIH